MPRKAKWIGIAVVGLFIVGVGGLIASGGTTGSVIGGVLMGMFGLFMTAFGLATLRPGAAYLRIDAEGIAYKQVFKEFRYRWEDLEAFGEMDINGTPFVGFRLGDDHPKSKRKMRKIDRAVTGWDYNLPDNYGMNTAQLAALLSQRRMRHLARR
jgi:hypothetical protein